MFPSWPAPLLHKVFKLFPLFHRARVECYLDQISEEKHNAARRLNKKNGRLREHICGYTMAAFRKKRWGIDEWSARDRFIYAICIHEIASAGDTSRGWNNRISILLLFDIKYRKYWHFLYAPYFFEKYIDIMCRDIISYFRDSQGRKISPAKQYKSVKMADDN